MWLGDNCVLPLYSSIHLRAGIKAFITSPLLTSQAGNKTVAAPSTAAEQGAAPCFSLSSHKRTQIVRDISQQVQAPSISPPRPGQSKELYLPPPRDRQTAASQTDRQMRAAEKAQTSLKQCCWLAKTKWKATIGPSPAASADRSLQTSQILDLC